MGFLATVVGDAGAEASWAGAAEAASSGCITEVLREKHTEKAKNIQADVE